MPATYEKIATTTLGSAATNITFSSIAASWTDLRWVITYTGDATAAGQPLLVELNGDSGANYSFTELRGNGATASSLRTTGRNYFNATVYNAISTTIPMFASGDIFSYAGSTFKTMLSQSSGDQNGSGNTESFVQLWRSTSAVTQVKIFTPAGNLATGTTATLYGILKA